MSMFSLFIQWVCIELYSIYSFFLKLLELLLGLSVPTIVCLIAFCDAPTPKQNLQDFFSLEVGKSASFF